MTEGPPLPKARTAAHKAGQGYERKVGRLFKLLLRQGKLTGELYLGQWLLFCDVNGIGRAQPDIYVVKKDFVLLVECKLTQTDTALIQLRGLYSPLIHHFYGKPVVMVEVYKNMRVKPKYLTDDPLELGRADAGGKVHEWHYMGL